MDHIHNHSYGRSESYTIGVEEEFQILDPKTGELVSKNQEILALIEEGEKNTIKPELFQCMLEISTTPTRDLAAIESELHTIRARCKELANQTGVALASAGTHPYSHHTDQEVVPKPRYKQIAENMQEAVRRQIIFGTHIHVGLPDPECAVYVANAIRNHLAELVVFSANSPYWSSRDTGMQSYRLQVFSAFPRSGVPPRFENWQDYSDLVHQGVKSGVMADETYIWWDIRPHPRYGTVEVRVFDAQQSVRDTVALAALVQSMARYYTKQHAAGQELFFLPDFYVRENKWQAVRHGCEGQVLTHDGMHDLSFQCKRLLDTVRPYAVTDGTKEGEKKMDEYFSYLEKMLTSGGAARQREIGNSPDLMHDLIRAYSAK